MVEHLRMLAAETLAGAGRGAHHQRRRQAAARQIAHRRRLRGQLVERHAKKFDEHDLDDRLQPADGGADGRTHKRHLRNRRVDDAFGTVRSKQPLGDLERAAGRGDVLAHQNHRRIVRHRVVEGAQHSLPDPDLRQDKPPNPPRCYRYRPGRLA